jgi:RimJ/RimL family protein N-acetyltransferase
LVLEEALVLGYTRVTADTAETNSAAIHVLQAAGFTLMQPDGRHRVRADILLRNRTGSRLP